MKIAEIGKDVNKIEIINKRCLNPDGNIKKTICILSFTKIDENKSLTSINEKIINKGPIIKKIGFEKNDKNDIIKEDIEDKIINNGNFLLICGELTFFCSFFADKIYVSKIDNIVKSIT
jgi:hypothetical protein